MKVAPSNRQASEKLQIRQADPERDGNLELGTSLDLGA